MKKVLFLSLFVASAVLAACLLPRNNSSLEGLAKANVEALASVPVEVTCIAGGAGSSSCSMHWTVGPAEYECSVNCIDGYYACCNIAQCHCIRY